MKIGLIQIDGKLPNLALMQITAYHEARGDSVEWAKPFISGDLIEPETDYDLLYASKIFSFTKLPRLPRNTLIGGTGINFTNTLPPEIASCIPSFSLHPNFNAHLGFSMKGCRFKCKFCCVPQKEGKPHVNSDIADLLINPNGENRLILMDNDFFGGSNWRVNLERIIELGLRVCFVQGLNIRIITDEQAELLSQCRYDNANFNHRYISFAWDRFRDEERIVAGIKRCNRYGIKPEHMQFFVLIGYDTTHEQNMHRVMFLRDLGCYPYAMPYDRSNPYQAAFTRWVNHRATFMAVPWQDYKRAYFSEEDMAPANPPKRRELPVIS